MRDIKVILLLLLLSIFFYSCNYKYEYSVTDIKEKLSVVGIKDTTLDSDLGIISIGAAGKYLIAYHHFKKLNNCFSIYCIESENKPVYVSSFGIRGNGPDEFKVPTYTSQFSMENGETKIWILDMPMKKYIKVNIDKTIQMNEMVVEDRLTINCDYEIKNIFRINDSLLFGIQIDNESREFIYNTNKNEIIYSSVRPIFNQNENMGNNFWGITQGVNCFNSKTKTILTTCFELPLINISSISQNNDKIIMTDIYYDKFIPYQDYKYHYGSMSYFLSVASNENYICMLYFGDLSSEEDYAEITNILIFDWDMNPIVNLKIPMATWITIDENNILYALNFNVEKNMLEIFDLNKILAEI